MHKYRLVAKKGEGTFSEVLKAQCIKNGKYVAIKCMKNHFDSLDQVNNLREIQALRRLSPHPGIIKLLEVLYDQPTGRLALVFELMDMNIYELIRGRRHYVAEDRVKNYMYQLMKAMDHMHRNGIFHRDIKPENILIMDDCLKLADFGSCRGIYSKQPYTEYISTRWYRAPECLLTDGYYNYKMDMWGVGCVFFEIVSLFPLFPGTNELDQIQKIHNILGTPPEELLKKMKKRSAHMDFNFPTKEGSGIPKLIPHVTPDCCDLVVKLLMYNPDDRLSARQALRHPYFKELREAEKKQKALNTPDATLGASTTSSGIGMGHELDKARAQATSPAGSEGDITSPPSMSESGTMGLPTIHAKTTTLPPAKELQRAAGSADHAAELDGMADSSHRLPGLGKQDSQVSLDGTTDGDPLLPPIAGGGAVKNGTFTRRAAVSYYDAQHAKSKGAAATAAGVPPVVRRQSMGPGTLPKYAAGGAASGKSMSNGGVDGTGSNGGVAAGGAGVLAGGVAGGALAGGMGLVGAGALAGGGAVGVGALPGKEGSYKTKANSKQPSKYVSPYGPYRTVKE